MSEISDGRLYDENDMVKAECGDCKGCHDCCTGMGASIVLDPLDIYRMTRELNTTFEGLLNGHIELNVADGIILPNLTMAGKAEACSFLDSNGRCTIHSARPSICRLFPLGRIYENGDFKYFLQVNECSNKNRTKVKVHKWIDVEDTAKNHEYVCDWHYYLKHLMDEVKKSQDEAYAKNVSMAVLTVFYLTPYDTNRDFYEQFYERLKKADK